MKLAGDITGMPRPTAGAKRAFASDVAKTIGERNNRKGMFARLTDKTPQLVSGVYGKTDAMSNMVWEDFRKRGSRLDAEHLAIYDGLFTGLFARSANAEKKFDYAGFAARRAAFYGAEGDFVRLYQKGFRLAGKVKELRDKRQIEAAFTEAGKNLPELTDGDRLFLADLAQVLSEVL